MRPGADACTDAVSNISADLRADVGPDDVSAEPRANAGPDHIPSPEQRANRALQRLLAEWVQ